MARIRRWWVEVIRGRHYECGRPWVEHLESCGTRMTPELYVALGEVHQKIAAAFKEPIPFWTPSGKEDV